MAHAHLLSTWYNANVSSLVKQNKKAKICFVIHIAGEIFFLFMMCRFSDERTPIEATPLSATSAELGLGSGLGIGFTLTLLLARAPLFLAPLLLTH